MTQMHDEQLSAVLDGELSADELNLLLARLDRDGVMRSRLGRYALIGECLRGGSASPAALGVADRVRSAIAVSDGVAMERPHPSRRIAKSRWLPAGLAAAAAVLAIWVVGSDGWRLGPAPAGPAIEAQVDLRAVDLLNPPVDRVIPVANRRLNPRAAARLTSYLVAHGEYTNEFSRNAVDSHLVTARAARAAWRQPQGSADGR